MVYYHLGVREARYLGKLLPSNWGAFSVLIRWAIFQVYEQHPFWCTGFTYWDLHSEAPDLFLHLSKSDLAIFKGDLNHRKLTYDCHAPASTPFHVAIGPMASAAGAPRVCSLRTIKSDVVVGLGDEGDEIAERMDKEEPGWKISGKYVSIALPNYSLGRDYPSIGRLLFPSPKAVRERKSGLLRESWWDAPARLGVSSSSYHLSPVFPITPIILMYTCMPPAIGMPPLLIRTLSPCMNLMIISSTEWHPDILSPSHPFSNSI